MDMGTADDREAVRRVCDALTLLNKTLAACADRHIQVLLEKTGGPGYIADFQKVTRIYPAATTHTETTS
jgi:hypothetical protein